MENSLCEICWRIDGANRASHANHFWPRIKRYSEDSRESIRLLNKPRRTNILLVDVWERLQRADICEQIQALDPLSSFDWQRRVWTSLVISEPACLSANQVGWYQLSNWTGRWFRKDTTFSMSKVKNKKSNWLHLREGHMTTCELSFIRTLKKIHVCDSNWRNQGLTCSVFVEQLNARVTRDEKRIGETWPCKVAAFPRIWGIRGKDERNKSKRSVKRQNLCSYPTRDRYLRVKGNGWLLSLGYCRHKFSTRYTEITPAILLAVTAGSRKFP